MSGRLLPPGLLSRLWMDRGIAVVAVLVVAVTSGTAATVGRSLEQLTSTSVEDEVARADPSAVGVTSSRLVDRELGDADLLERLRALGEETREGFPNPLPALVDDPAIVVDSVRFQLSPLPGEAPLPLATNLTFRAQDAGDALSVTGQVPTAPVEEFTFPTPVTGRGRAPAPVHQIALSSTTMERVGLAVGDRVLAFPDPADPLARRAGIITLDPIVVEVVGTLGLSATDEPVWWGDPRLHRPAQIDTGTTTTYFAFGWVPLDVPGVLPGDGSLPAQVDWRHPVAPARVAEADAARTLDAARALTAQNAGLSADFRQVVSTSALDRVLGDEAIRRGVAVNVLRLGMVAVGGVGVAVLALLATLLADRRRERTALTMGRGASRVQLVLGASVEASLLVSMGGVLGLAIATVLVSGPTAARDLAVVAGVAVASAVALVVGGTREDRRPLRDLLQTDARPEGTSLRGRVIEGAVVLVAVAGIFALRDRGVDAAAPDPFVVVVPALVGLAAGLLVRRLHRIPIRGAAAAASRRLGIALPIGLLRGARQDLAGPMLVVVVLAAAVALFAGAVTTTIGRGQDVAAWEDVGAHHRLRDTTGAALPPLTVDGAVVVEAFEGLASMNSGGAAFGRGELIATDLAAMQDLLATTTAPLRLPPRVLVDVPVTEDGAAPIIPAIASVGWFGAEQLRINDQVDVTIGTERRTFQVVGLRSRLLGLDEDDTGPFLVVPRAPAEAVLGAPLPTTTQFVGAGTTPGVLEAVTGPDVTVTSQTDVRAALGERALPAGVAAGFLGIAATSLLLAALAIVVWQTLTARDRVRDLAVLAAIGTTRRARFGIAMAEGIPAVVIGIVAGSFVGRVVGDLLDGVIDLAPFTSTTTVDDVVSTTALTAWGTLGIVVVAVLLIAALVWRGERVTTSKLLRQD